jgi:2-dehydro-3-deoxyphosphogluconate aldolase / (4S)-4-hydroxy-2-oxoglutarate aldolase
MEREEYLISRIESQRVLPLFYHANEQKCLALVEALYDAGIRVIEFVNRGADALPHFAAIRAKRDTHWKDLILGVGTILSAEQARQFIAAGADFLVSPVVDPAIADEAYMQKVLWIPGCMTPTEIHEAVKAGCRLVKLFPGAVLGPSFVSAVRELFPTVKMMPTGGVQLNQTNIQEWFNSGVVAVGMGSQLLSKATMASDDLGPLRKQTELLLQWLKEMDV